MTEQGNILMSMYVYALLSRNNFRWLLSGNQKMTYENCLVNLEVIVGCSF